MMLSPLASISSRLLWLVLVATLATGRPSLEAAVEETASATPLPDSFVYFGTFTYAPGGGIFMARLNATSGMLSPAILAAPAGSPGFLATDPASSRLYAVEETKKNSVTLGMVDAFQVNTHDGHLSLINRQTTPGGSFCYLALDRSAHYLGAARYNDGNAALLPLSSAGEVQPISSLVQHEGTGPNKERQERAHVHSINFDPSNRFAIVADLGTDEIWSYHFNASTGQLTPSTPAFVSAPPGSGPRHFAFHPSGKFAYAVCEMSASVVSYSYDNTLGTLTQTQISPLIPDNIPGERRAAEVVIDRAGNFLYVSNRGYDALVVYAINPSTGQLTWVQREHEGLAYPRNFAIDPSGRWLLCANRDSNSVTVYAIDRKTGRIKLTPVKIKVPQPVCVRFLSISQ